MIIQSPVQDSITDSRIIFHGVGNQCVLLGNARLNEAKLDFLGDHGLVVICPTKFPVRMDAMIGYASTIFLGENLFTANICHYAANEGTFIYVGRNSLISYDVWIRTSDMHLIYDLYSGERIAHNKDVYLGESSWVGQNSLIGKGVVLGDGSVIGMGSVCTGRDMKECNAVYAGHPARLIRRNIMWFRRGTNSITEQDMRRGRYEKIPSGKNPFGQKQFQAKYQTFTAEFNTARSVFGAKSVEQRLQLLMKEAEYATGV